MEVGRKKIARSLLRCLFCYAKFWVEEINLVMNKIGENMSGTWV